jgi:NAD(P)-dependent dehydrogenase (short-subunit alcohol dehydrogenase family)
MPANDPIPASGPLAGKVAIVTGGGRGLGAAIAAGLAADGARTIVWFRNDSEAARSVVRGIEARGGSAASRRVDVTSRAEVDQAVAELGADGGRIDILVNNAGVMRRSPVLELSDADWHAVLDTNLTAYFIVSQLVGRVMAAQGSGSIVHVSSTNDRMASTDCTAYAAAKGGVAMLNRQLALELGPLGIRSNAVSPGMVETDLNRAQLADGPFRKSALDRIPLGRFVQPDDVAGAVRYLASDLARSVNGTTVRVDAGRTVA